MRRATICCIKETETGVEFRFLGSGHLPVCFDDAVLVDHNGYYEVIRDDESVFAVQKAICELVK